MIEHSVPQNVTSYQFHLIGNMTIKQFLLLLSGIGVAGLLYTTNLPFIIKWPLILIFVLIGIAMAFVPYEERSLDQWLINFVRAMYRPTKFFWRRLAETPDIFLYTPRSTGSQQTYQPSISRAGRQQRVDQYLKTIRPATSVEESTDPLDLFSRDSSNFNALFEEVSAAKNVLPSEEVAAKPKLGVRSRPLKEITYAEMKPQAVPAQTVAPSAFAPAPVPVIAPEPIPIPSTVQEPALQASVAPVTALEDIQIDSKAVDEHQIAAATNTAPSDISANQAPVYSEVTAPENPAASNTVSAPLPTVFNRSLPFPSLPSQPNLLIGMIFNHENKSLANAILEIKNEQGNTVRALKSNPLGQFYTSTPLPAGNYTIEIELDGYTFPKYSLEISNQILDPIEIRATSST